VHNVYFFTVASLDAAFPTPMDEPRKIMSCYFLGTLPVSMATGIAFASSFTICWLCIFLEYYTICSSDIHSVFLDMLSLSGFLLLIVLILNLFLFIFCIGHFGSAKLTTYMCVFEQTSCIILLYISHCMLSIYFSVIAHLLFHSWFS